MNRAIILQSIMSAETKLLELSQAVQSIEKIDTMNDWIVRVIRDQPELSRYLHLPTQPKITEAIVTLVESNSDLTNPFINLLATRISAYVSTIKDLHAHPLRGPLLDPLVDNFESLVKQIAKYHYKHEHTKTVALVYGELQNHRLHIYKTSPNESDLRVVLRAFYEDSSRTDEGALVGLLEFVLEQLKEEVRHPGYISQPRHAWWALLTIFENASRDWLVERRPHFMEIVRQLLSSMEYAPRIDKNFRSVVPELDSIFNEHAWVAINSIRLLKRQLSLYISTAVLRRLNQRIQSLIERIINVKTEDSLLYLQSTLILLYEALGHYNAIEARKMTSVRKLRLRSNTIGVYIYDDGMCQYL